MKLPAKDTKYFQDEVVPSGTQIAGFSALVQSFDLNAPVRQFSCVSAKRIKEGVRAQGAWHVYDNRRKPEETVEGHLNFAMKYESFDLLILKELFQKIKESVIEQYVLSAPTGTTNRQVWFLYEWLLDTQLNIPDAPKVVQVDLLNPDQYFTGKGRVSTRHRVNNNLLGTSQFCPIIRRTESLNNFVESDLSEKAQKIVGPVSADVLSRAASFLLLADTKASFYIEGEKPGQGRIQRWGKAIHEAGRNPLSLEEIERLHSVLIPDSRFTQIGFRKGEVFIGEHSRDQEPLPEFIGARAKDVKPLMSALIEANELMGQHKLDPVLQAAAIAFGFVYIHPLEDGNGRLHRYLIHHVLAKRKFSPDGLVFPVSAVMLARIRDYASLLKSHSAPLLEFIDWVPAADGNVEVKNDTSDLYRYIDCTDEAEFLYSCVKKTVEHDLPYEIEYLNRHDEAKTAVMNMIDMPDRLADLFVTTVQKNDGQLPKKRRKKEFAALTDKEVEKMESAVNRAFVDFEQG